MDLPAPKDKDEDETWTTEDEERFEWYFGELLDSIHEKFVRAENDIEYWDYWPVYIAE